MGRIPAGSAGSGLPMVQQMSSGAGGGFVQTTMHFESDGPDRCGRADAGGLPGETDGAKSGWALPLWWR